MKAIIHIGLKPGVLDPQGRAIARSLAMKPDVILFDEVTAALDPETVNEVLVTIKDLAEEGMTCILVTHEMEVAEYADRQIHFRDGQVERDERENS